MISVSRLNGSAFWVAAEQIESIESTPDTILTLLSGKKLIVRETPAQVVERVVEYKRRCLRMPEVLVDKQGKET